MDIQERPQLGKTIHIEESFRGRVSIYPTGFRKNLSKCVCVCWSVSALENPCIVPQCAAPEGILSPCILKKTS